ncbi:MAG: ATP-dependent nuclease [Dongiaceae bacterium]
MLEKLRLQNFRGFRDHTIPFRPMTVIVGRNNAGKSTIIEALRLLSIIVARYRGLTYFRVPNWLTIAMRNRGVAPSLQNIEFDYENVCHRYGDPPAIITATFKGGERIEIYLNPLEKAIFGVIRQKNGEPIISRSQATQMQLPIVSILPQIGPLAKFERVLTPEYVRSALETNLASLHFRNQLHLFAEHYKEFATLAEDTWPGFQVQDFDVVKRDSERQLSLLVRDGTFVAEIGWMGHGLQVWLQTMWFLSRSQKAETVILDEPDIFLHADVQRRITRLIRQKHKQVIVATHSIEIMAEVSPEDILIVDKSERSSKFAASIPAVQSVIDRLGGVHNIQLSRLWMAKKCLLIEGDDVPYLKALQAKCFPDSQQPVDVVPNVSIGGWGGWKLAAGSSMLMKYAGDRSILTYCVLDRDYHTDDEISEIGKEAALHGLQLHVWKRKEIENYLVSPPAILRLITRRVAPGIAVPQLREIEQQIEHICDARKDEVFDALSTELLVRNRSAGPASANAAARLRLATCWTSLSGKISVVSGKQLLSDLSDWSKKRFNVSFTRLALAEELQNSEIDSEMLRFLSRFEKAETLD